MTDPAAIMSKAMQESRAWPAVFSSGSANELSRAALAALEAAGFVCVPKEPTGPMWSAGKAAVSGPLEMIRTATRYEEASAHEDRVPDKLWSAMVEAGLGTTPAKIASAHKWPYWPNPTPHAILKALAAGDPEAFISPEAEDYTEGQTVAIDGRFDMRKVAEAMVEAGRKGEG